MLYVTVDVKTNTPIMFNTDQIVLAKPINVKCCEKHKNLTESLTAVLLNDDSQLLIADTFESFVKKTQATLSERYLTEQPVSKEQHCQAVARHS